MRINHSCMSIYQSYMDSIIKRRFMEMFQWSLKGKPHVFAGKIKDDVNVVGDLGVGFSLENSSLRVGVIFRDPCEAGFGWDGNGNRGNTRWGKQTKYCGCKSLGLHHIGLIRKRVRGIRISCKSLRGGHVILCGVLAEHLNDMTCIPFFLGWICRDSWMAK